MINTPIRNFATHISGYGKTEELSFQIPKFYAGNTGKNKKREAMYLYL
jgi:hypothetical protein